MRVDVDAMLRIYEMNLNGFRISVLSFVSEVPQDIAMIHLVLFGIIAHSQCVLSQMNQSTPVPTLPNPASNPSPKPTTEITKSPTILVTKSPSDLVTESLSITDILSTVDDESQSTTYSTSDYQMAVGAAVMIALLVGVICFFIGICTKTAVDRYCNKPKYGKHERMSSIEPGSPDIDEMPRVLSAVGSIRDGKVSENDVSFELDIDNHKQDVALAHNGHQKDYTLDGTLRLQGSIFATNADPAELQGIQALDRGPADSTVLQNCRSSGSVIEGKYGKKTEFH